jgi:hypothetical protein
MPTIRVTEPTMRLIRQRSHPAYRFHALATRLDDGCWNVAFDDEAAFQIAREQQRAESDDDVVARLLRCPPVKPGTRVEIGLGLGKVETGVVMRWTKAMGRLPGYRPILFDSDGAQLMVHGRGIRIVDHRPRADR